MSPLDRLLLFSVVGLGACSAGSGRSSRSAEPDVDKSVCVELGLELVEQNVPEQTVAQVVANCEIQCGEADDDGDACEDLGARLESEGTDEATIERVQLACRRSQAARRSQCAR